MKSGRFPITGHPLGPAALTIDNITGHPLGPAALTIDNIARHYDLT